MKCFYHNDLGGRCAGAIVKRHYDFNYDDRIEMIEVDYKDVIEVERIEPAEKIVIVDFSFKPDVMAEVLKQTTDIIWLDHHKTAFEYDYGQVLPGIRDKEFSGCELAWKYYCGEKIPYSVMLIGDRDKWAWEYGDDTAYFNQGIKLFPHQPEDGIWDNLFKDIGITGIIEKGKICLQFRDSFCTDYANSYGFETDFDGYNCFAMGLYMFGSEAFGERMGKYDICISFEYTKKNYIVGLYSKNIDVSEMAKKYGGGGHKGAAGFVTLELPFIARGESKDK